MLKFSTHDRTPAKENKKDRDKRNKEKDKEKDKDKDRERRHKSSRPHKKRSSSTGPKSSSSLPGSATRERDDSKEMLPDLARQELLNGSSSLSPSPSPSPRKASVPYPSFSKAHSKESVAREFGDAKKVDVITPDPTDLGRSAAEARRGSRDRLRAEDGKTEPSRTTPGAVPPSPPLTAVSQLAREGTTPESATKQKETVKSKSPLGQHVNNGTRGSGRPHSRTAKLSSEKRKDRSSRTPSETSKRSSRATTPKSRAAAAATVTVEDEESSPPPSQAKDDQLGAQNDAASTIDSEATSRARDQPPVPSDQPESTTLLSHDVSASSASHQDSSLPTTANGFLSPPLAYQVKSPPVVAFDPRLRETPLETGSPKPPPPPPPPMPNFVPRVDYLLYNGGLPRNVPRTLLAAGARSSPPLNSQSQVYQQLPPSSTPVPPLAAEIEKIFSPFHGLLDQYDTVLSKNGSIAVATGYRSVARRLLDRLEAVFARDISSEKCSCAICQRKTAVEAADERSLGWGDILEWVSGRREIPTWPAFDFSSLGDPGTQAGEVSGLGILDGAKKWWSGNQQHKSPPIDVDVPEEFRAHYIRQSKKTKQAVDCWLSSQPMNPSSPPQEIDDETLTFAILTHLEQHERPIFTALLTSSFTSSPQPPRPGSRGPTPSLKPRSELICKTGTALQRLYRLPKPPRDPESAIFLLRHPDLHNVLSTLAAVSSPEWDVLTSGRFDGFLWSGADDPSQPTPNPSTANTANASTSSIKRYPSFSPNPTTSAGRGPLSGPGPSPLSRTTTPFSTGGSDETRRGSSSISSPFRTTTPFHNLASSVSRGTTPAPGPPVPHDEETEIAVLAEVEREIYLGMEALEDAFEGLHRKAEQVRRALRERGAGLSMAGQSRRFPGGGANGSVEVMSGTPALGGGATNGFGNGAGGAGWESEDDIAVNGGLAGPVADDLGSELWPDDSASNVSSSRVRRPKRRNERRTPAAVEEEEEEEEEEEKEEEEEDQMGEDEAEGEGEGETETEGDVELDR
ncbi:MAG: hypothetical protein M1837_007374 [Sclerophora amabilis]|nr:MAG: hypothetical protein M1837_007374 [Sclerophora amabilis]